MTKINSELIPRASLSAKVVVEIGCSDGALCRRYLRRNPNAKVIGIDHDTSKISKASKYITHTIAGTIESDDVISELDKILGGAKIDQLIIGNVLEFLIDPRAVMSLLLARMSSTGRAVVAVTNVAHWSMHQKLLAGEWPASNSEHTEQQPTQFFTLNSAKDLFANAGWDAKVVTAHVVDREQTVHHSRQIAKTAKALRMDTSVAYDNAIAHDWVFTLTAKKLVAPRQIIAIGIGTEIDALSKIRVVQPLTTLRGLGVVRPKYSIPRYTGFPEGPPGFFFSYRLHPENKARRLEIMQKCKEGWLFIHDVDDHPAYLNGQKRNDFWSIKAAHAVTVSTPELVEVCKQWNPNVHLVRNQIFEVSEKQHILKGPDGKPTLFFGALNRKDEWQQECGSIVSYLQENAKHIRAKIIHEPSLFDALQAKADAQFIPTQTYEGFIQHLSECDMALLPLFDSEFNRCKSDLKIIECLAHGVVPICSPFAAQQTSVPNELLTVALNPHDWTKQIQNLLDNPDEMARRKLAGYEYLCQNRTWAANSEDLATLYKGFWTNRERLEFDRAERMFPLSDGRLN